MADSKLTALAANAGPEGADLLYLVDDPAGSPASEKVTVEQLRTAISGRLDFTEKTSGDTAITATSPTGVSGVADISVPAVEDDVVEIGLMTAWLQDVDFGHLNVSAVVSATPGTPLYGDGSATVSGWRGQNQDGAPQVPVSGSFYYTVQAGDLDGGAITLRLMGWLAGAGSRTIKSDAAQPLQFFVKNHGQP